MFNLGKAKRLKAEIKEIQELILAQSINFSGKVSQRVDDDIGTMNEMNFNEYLSKTVSNFVHIRT